MKKYYELINILINNSDCVAFEIEAYECIFHRTTEDEIKEIFITNLKKE